MAVSISYGVLHTIIKEQNSTEIVVEPRSDCLPVDQNLKDLVQDVLKIYGKKNNSYGTFDSDLVAYPFPTYLNAYLSNSSEGGFYQFSRDSLSLIARETGQSRMATGGKMVLVRYQHQQREWLLIVMLKMKEAKTVNDQQELDNVDILDIEHLHEAARIDIEKYQSETEPYLSFIKKKSSQEDVSLYFRTALGCTEYTEASLHTAESMKAVDDYADEMEWDQNRRLEARKAYYEYCAEKKQAGEPVNLESLSARIDDQNPQGYRDFVRDNEYAVNDEFEPHPATYNKFKRVSAKMGSIRLSFDVKDLTDGRITPNDDYTSLTINRITPALADMIRDAYGNDSTD